jgi:iron complex transport system permease protein
MTGAILSLAVVLFAAREDRTVHITRMILAGAAVHSLSSAGLTLLLIRMSGRPDAGGLYFWLLGGLAPLPWPQLIILSILAVAALTALFAMSPAMNLLTLGPESATALGLPANRAAWTALLFAAMATGLAVTFNGMIPFVGLLVPHAARAFAGADHRKALPVSAALGALLLVAADALARWICAPREIPTGVVTALAGAPFFLFLLYRRRILP